MVSKLYGYGIIEEAYPGLSQTSKMESFAAIVNG